MMLESCSWFIKIQQKKNCPQQMDYLQDISNPEGEGSMLIYLPTGRRGLNNNRKLDSLSESYHNLIFTCSSDGSHPRISELSDGY